MIGHLLYLDKKGLRKNTQKWFMLIIHLYMLPWDYTLNAHYEDCMGYLGAHLCLYLLNAHAHPEFWFFVKKAILSLPPPSRPPLYCVACYSWVQGTFNAPSLVFFQFVYSRVFFFICQICHILFPSSHDMSHDTTFVLRWKLCFLPISNYTLYIVCTFTRWARNVDSTLQNGCIRVATLINLKSTFIQRWRFNFEILTIFQR